MPETTDNTQRMGRGANDEYYLDYIKGSLTFPRNIFHAPKLKTAARLAVALPAGAAVLDAGCGAGIVSAGMGPRVKLTGVDIEAESINYCQNCREGEFICSPLETLPFSDNHFDLILFTNAIEHLADTHPVLKELTRVLKPGGKIFITTENCANIFWLFLEQTWYRFFGGPCKPYMPEVHPQRFTPKSLRRDIEQHLKIEKLIRAMLGMELMVIATK